MSAPILIIPVYRGGTLLARCLKTVKAAGHCFCRVVISLNGDLSGEDKSIVVSELGSCQNILVLETPHTLNPVAHLAWIADQLHDTPRTQRVLLLAHDDELEADAVLDWCNSLEERPRNLAWIGPYRVVFNETHTAVISSAPSSSLYPLMPPQEWLRKYSPTPRCTVFTNMSGMSVELGVLTHVMRYCQRTHGRKGLRFEVMLLTHASVEGVVEHVRPLAVIHEHAGQEGKNVLRSDWYSDEIRCSIWLLGNATGVGNFLRMLLGPWGMRHICGSAARFIREACFTALMGHNRKWR